MLQREDESSENIEQTACIDFQAEISIKICTWLFRLPETPTRVSGGKECKYFCFVCSSPTTIEVITILKLPMLAAHVSKSTLD
jgi:hypothetical protein